MSDDDYGGFSNLESSQDVSMGFGVSGLTQRPADEDTDPYNFEINIKGNSNADATPWMTEEERREKSKPKKKIIKAGDTSAMNKANKWLKKAKKKKEKKSKKKVETLDNLSLSEDDMSSDLDGNSGHKKPKKRSMQFKVPTASSRGMTRSSALTNLGNVRTFDDDDDSDDIDIAESFSKAKVSPKSNKLPGGLEAFMSSSQRSDDSKSSKNEIRSKRLEDKYSTVESIKKSSPSSIRKSEIFGNVMSFGDMDMAVETERSATKNEVLGNVVSFEDHMKEEISTAKKVTKSNDSNDNISNKTTLLTSSYTNKNNNNNQNTNRSEAFGNVKSFDGFNSVPVKNEAFGKIRGIEDLGMIDGDDDAIEESMEESIGVEELIDDEIATSKSRSNNINENNYRHNPTPPPLQSQVSNVTDYSMEDFEQDGYSMDDFETSIQESGKLNNNNSNTSDKKSRKRNDRKPLSTIDTNDNDIAKVYRGPSPRTKSAKFRTSPANANLKSSYSKQTFTREIGIQATSGVDIGIQAEMVPLPPLGMDPYMYHMGLGRPQFGIGRVYGRQYDATGIQNNPYAYPRFGGQQYWAQPRSTQQQTMPQSHTKTASTPFVSQENTTTTNNNNNNNVSINTSVEDPPIDNLKSKIPRPVDAYEIPAQLQSQLSQSNDLFKRQLALIRQQIDKSRNRALQAQAAMHYKTYEIIKQQSTKT